MPPQQAGPVADLRRDANNHSVDEDARRDKKNARAELEKLNLRPEVTAIDSLAIVHTEGEYNLMPDSAHIVEGGVGKCCLEVVKGACDDKTACSHGHGIAVSAAVIDDVVKAAGGHNTGVDGVFCDTGSIGKARRNNVPTLSEISDCVCWLN